MSVVRKMLMDEEGRKNEAYPDPLTHGAPWTIGVGHTGPEVHEGLVWTDQQIDQALDGDILKAVHGCRQNLPWFDGLDEVRQAVLIGMAFQMGVAGLMGFPHFLAAMRDQRWNAAAGELLSSLWAKQTPKRAGRCARAVETGDSQWA